MTYKLIGKKPELSYNVNIAYHGDEQLQALEYVYGSIPLSTKRREEGYFGITYSSKVPNVWINYGEDETIIRFVEVFEEELEPSVKTNLELLEFTATALDLYRLGKVSRKEKEKESLIGKQAALDSLFDNVLIPKAKDGLTGTSFRWQAGSTSTGQVAVHFTKSEFKEAMGNNGYEVDIEEDYDAERRKYIDVVYITWDRGE